MASLSTPQGSTRRPSSLETDGISTSKNHLPRSEVVQQIYDTAKERQHVVISSSPATGKTSLLQLLKKRLKKEEVGANVARINMDKTMTVESLFEELAEEGGIVKETTQLRRLKNTWLLLDDAQNAYDNSFAPVWQFLVKTISSTDVDDNLLAVIAATYDLATPESSVNFFGLAHIDRNVSKDEARELFEMHAVVWGYQDWGNFIGTLIEISEFPDS